METISHRLAENTQALNEAQNFYNQKEQWNTQYLWGDKETNQNINKIIEKRQKQTEKLEKSVNKIQNRTHANIADTKIDHLNGNIAGQYNTQNQSIKIDEQFVPHGTFDASNGVFQMENAENLIDEEMFEHILAHEGWHHWLRVQNPEFVKTPLKIDIEEALVECASAKYLGQETKAYPKEIATAKKYLAEHGKNFDFAVNCLLSQKQNALWDYLMEETQN